MPLADVLARRDPWAVVWGDCLATMPDMPDASVDAIVTDPPYGLAFMGKAWDHGVPGVPFWVEALRVAKPGAYLVAFGGTRTFHRLTCAIEDAGWEIRDCLSWLYGSGFPKSLDVSKAMDKAAGAEREVVGANPFNAKKGGRNHSSPLCAQAGKLSDNTAPATDLARQWQGWGTALKPAWEPIILARKPLIGTVAANVAAHGTGGLNVDGCRIGTESRPVMVRTSTVVAPSSMAGASTGATASGDTTTQGRWPANVCLDEDAAGMLDAQTGTLTSGKMRPTHTNAQRNTFGQNAEGGYITMETYGDTGGASRFFYTAKASRREREAGLGGQRIVYVSCPLWKNADHKAKLRVDMEPSRPRVIAVSGAPCNDATVWSTFLFGSDTTAPYLTATKSITGTATNSTTDSTTSNSFHHWLTSGCMEDASGEAESGGSRAASAVRGTPSLTITSEWTVSARGVERALSPTPFTISAGGSPADHPTVKPIALMRWLCRLVTPPNGLVLDPFAGSGTTGCAAVLEGFRFVGCEQEAEYVEIAKRRIAHVQGPLFSSEK